MKYLLIGLIFIIYDEYCRKYNKIHSISDFKIKSKANINYIFFTFTYHCPIIKI